jgi:hypothetical protein
LPRQELVQTWLQENDVVRNTGINPHAVPWEPISIQPIDAWIDSLVPGQETVLPPSTHVGINDHLVEALVKLESDRGLPATVIPFFDGSPIPEVCGTILYPSSLQARNH